MKLNTLNSLPQSRVRRDHLTFSQALISSVAATHPLGYPSIADWISADIDGRVYRRFTYVRNGILLRYQYRIAKLEEELLALDHEDELKASQGDAHAKTRLMSWRYNDFPPPTDPKRSTRRKELFDLLEAALEKYDDLLQREHAIMSIQRCPRKMHKSLFDFIFNGKFVDGLSASREDKIKHLPPSEYLYLARRDDFLLLGSQDDTWLHTYTGYDEG